MSKGQSRDINNLNWYVKKKYLELEAECKKQGIKIVVFETTRSNSYQEKLYSYGRTDMSKPIVTNMKKPVAHSEQIAIAFDIYVEIDGRAIWDGNHPHWQIVLKIARQMGFTCGHDWKMKDTCHFQLDEGLSTKQLLAGERPSWFYEKPTNPFEVLKSKNIISKEGFDWEKACNNSYPINGTYCKALITNFYKYKTKKWSFTFTEAVDYLIENKISSDRDYWLNYTQPNQRCSPINVRLLIQRMADSI